MNTFKKIFNKDKETKKSKDSGRHREQYNKDKPSTPTGFNNERDRLTVNTQNDGSGGEQNQQVTSPAHAMPLSIPYEQEQDLITEKYQTDWQDKEQYLHPSHSGGVADFIEYSCVRLQHSHVLERLKVQDQPFTVVDYGTSQGQNSIPIIHTLLQYIYEKNLLNNNSAAAAASGGNQRQQSDNAANQQQQPTTDICIVHEDALGNSFDTLFETIDSLNRTNDAGNAEQSKQQQSGNNIKRYGLELGSTGGSQVYTLASATSFFEQVMPHRSVTLGFTVACWHWLSTLPCNLTNTFHSIYASGQERAKWEETAAHDWYTLLSHRSNELMYGGILLISLYCVDQNNSTGGFERTHEAIDKVLESMAREQILTLDELDASSCPMYYRNESEYLNTELLSSLDLIVLHHEQQHLANPMYEEYKDNADEFAKRHTEWCRSWSQNTFYNAFTGDEEEKQRKIDLLYERLESYIRSHVYEFDGQPLVANIILQKNIPRHIEHGMALVRAQSGDRTQPFALGAAALAAGTGAGLGALAASSYDKSKEEPQMNGYHSGQEKHEDDAAARDARSGGAAIAAGDNRNDEQQPAQQQQQQPSATAPLPPVQARQVGDDELEYQLSDIMNVVLDACLRAGEELEDGYFNKRKTLNEVKLTKKRCEQVLVECLLHAFSACRVLAADSDQTDITEHLTFLIDTVGGAYNFLHDSPFCCISVGVLANKQLIAGVVHAPIMNTTYHAVLGQGSFVSNFRLLREEEVQHQQHGAGSYTIAGYTQVSKHRIKVSKTMELQDALIRTELIQTENDDDLQQSLQNLYALLSNQCQAVRMIGSIALNLCSAALGSTDVVYQIENPSALAKGNAPDGKQPEVNIPFACAIAGGVVILKEAGGVVVNSHNQSNDVSHFSLFAGNIVGTSNKDLASKMLELLGSNLATEHLRQDDKPAGEGIIHQQPASSRSREHQPAAVGGKNNPSTGDKTLDAVLNENNQQLGAEQGYMPRRSSSQQQQQPTAQSSSSIWSGWNLGSLIGSGSGSIERQTSDQRGKKTAPALPKSRPPDHLPSYQREYLNRVSPRR